MPRSQTPPADLGAGKHDEVIAVEEHVWTADLRDALVAAGDDAVELALGFPDVDERLRDVGDGRLERMAASGVDRQVLSVTTPGTQSLKPADAVALARDANDVMAAAVTAHPDRFTAMATLPTPDPDAAADELLRAVDRLGMVGAMVFPRTGERYLDHPSFRPVFAIAADRGVPIYVHPQLPAQAVRDSSLSGFGPGVDLMLSSGGWGWHAEAGLAALRLILAGTFDRHPGLQLMLGHWGEMLVAFRDRADVLSDVHRTLQRRVGDVIAENVLVTAGGIYSPRMLLDAVAAVGADRVLFAADDPYRRDSRAGAAREFLDSAPIGADDRARIASGNARRLGLVPPARRAA